MISGNDNFLTRNLLADSYLNRLKYKLLYDEHEQPKPPPERNPKRILRSTKARRRAREKHRH